MDSARHRAYTANGSGSVAMIDTTTNTSLKTVSLDSRPFGVAIDPTTNNLYVTQRDSGTLVRLNASTLKVTGTLSLGGGPVSIAVDPDTQTAYTANSGGHTVSKIDLSAFTLVDTITLSNSTLPADVAIDPDAHKVFVTSSGTDYNLYAIDTRTDSASMIGVGNYTYGVAIDPVAHLAYVGSAQNAAVRVYDTTTNAFKYPIALGTAQDRQGASYGVALDRAAKALYVTNLSGSSVRVVDLTQGVAGAVAETVAVGSGPYGVAVDTGTHSAYVANSGSSFVSVLDPRSFAPQMQPQAITFTSTPPTDAKIGGSYDVSATGGDSGNPVTFTVDASSDAGTCNLADHGDSTGTVSFTGAGQCVLDADQAGSSGYDAAPQAQQSFTIAANQPQAITFTTDPPSPAYVDDTYTVKATGGSSGNPVTFSTDMFDPDPNGNGEPNCLVSDNGDGTASVYFSETGTCNIYADQAGGPGYDAAPQVVQSFVIGQRTQAITFTSDPPSPAYVGSDYTVTATGGGSGNKVTFTTGDDTTDDACAVTNNGGSSATVQLTGAGTCDVVADQQGSNAYAAAPSEHQSFDVVQQPQAITFTTGAPTNAKVGGSYTVSASGGGSGNAVTFSKDSSSDPGTCTVDDNGDSTAKVTFTGRGDCVIDADQAGSRAYLDAPQTQQTIQVSARAQHITLTDNSPLQSRVGKSYTVKGTGGASGKPVTFRRDASSDPMTCVVTDNGDSTATVTFTGTGSCVVDGNQAGAKGFSAAPQAQLPLATGAKKQAIAITSAKQARYPVDTSYTVTASAGASGNAVVFRIDGTSTADCDITGVGQNGSTYSATVSFSGIGQCVVVADEAGSATYQPAPQQKLSLKVNAAQQAITFTTTPPDPAHVGQTYDVAATGGRSGNPVTFSIANPTKASCTIESTGDSTARVTFNLSHPCVILAAQAGSADGNYNPAPGNRQVVTVKK